MTSTLTASPLYQTLYDRIKQILDSRDKIAFPEIIGNSLYNFWKDADHERGIWRRTSWASYATASPSWETVIDLDSLSKAEGVTWSWSGADCFEPEYKRCIVALSRVPLLAALAHRAFQGERQPPLVVLLDGVHQGVEAVLLVGAAAVSWRSCGLA